MRKLTVLFAVVTGVCFGLATIAYRLHRDAPLKSVAVYDGFESSALSNLWDTSRFTSGAVTMQSNVVRSGHGAVKIVLQTGDTFEAGIKGSKDTERDELQEASRLVAKEGVLYEYAFSMFVPSDFPIVPARLVIAQWKQDCNGHEACSDASPVVALRYADGVLQITRQIAAHRVVLFETSDDLRGKWTDYRFQIRFATSDRGAIRAWLNGKQVADYAGVTAYQENESTGYANPSRFYFKMGLYRDRMAAPMTIYIDEYHKTQLPG